MMKITIITQACMYMPLLNVDGKCYNTKNIIQKQTKKQAVYMVFHRSLNLLFVDGVSLGSINVDLLYCSYNDGLADIVISCFLPLQRECSYLQ